MARREIVVWVDDLDGTEDRTVKTKAFSLDGVNYEIDLSGENERKLLHALAPFITSARVVKGKRHTTPPASVNGHGASGSNGRKPAKVDAEQQKAIREWAEKMGIKVSSMGRIPKRVVDGFHKAGGFAKPVPESSEVETETAKAVAEAVAAKATSATVLSFKAPKQRTGGTKKAAKKAVARGK